MKKKHLGSTFDDLLEEQGMLQECRAAAIKFKITHKLENALKPCGRGLLSKPPIRLSRRGRRK